MHDSNPTLNSEVRFWFRGKTSPTKADVMPLIESQPTMVPVFDGKRREGEYTPIVSGIADALAALQRAQLPMHANTAAERQQEFLFSLLALTKDASERVALLKQMGTFSFRRSQTKRDRQRRLRVAVADPDEGILSDQVTELMAIWRPEPRSFLDALLQRTGRSGARRGAQTERKRA